MLVKRSAKVTSREDPKRIKLEHIFLLAFHYTENYRCTWKFKSIQLFSVNWLL